MPSAAPKSKWEGGGLKHPLVRGGGGYGGGVPAPHTMSWRDGPALRGGGGGGGTPMHACFRDRVE